MLTDAAGASNVNATHPDFGDLRARLHEPPSRTNWDALCALIDATLEHDPRQVYEVWLPYALPQLSRWPARFRLAPEHWIARWERDNFCPELMLCAAFGVGNKADARTLSQLAEPGQLRHLEVNTRATAPRIVWQLLADPAASKLEYLYLYQRNASIFDRVRKSWVWDREATARLFDEGNAQTLRGLSLDLQEIDAGGVHALLVHPRMKNLRQLKLRSNILESLDHALRTLPTPEHLSNLEELAIPQAKLGAEACAMLARVPWRQHIKELVLERNPLGDESLAALLAHDALAQVGSLRLSYTEAGTSAVTALASRARPRLWCLELDGSKLDIAAMMSMRNGEFPSLKRLSLGSASIETASFLLAAPWVKQLERLDLHSLRIGDVGVRNLIDSGNEKLELLSLAQNALGDDAIAHLGEAPWARSLKTLSLARNGLSDEGVLPMLRGKWPALRQLDLSGNVLSMRSLEALLDGGFPSLEVIDITDMLLTPGLERTLLESEHLPKLREVRSFGIAIG